MSLREVYRDRWVVVVDKPSGVPSQGTRGGEPGVFELLAPRFDYLALHHRLDRPASGLLLLAVHRKANRGLAEAFRTHAARRTYLAVVDGEAHDGLWERPLDGRPALTEVRVLGRGAGATAVELGLHTGRTHQIRRHAALEGSPVLGDRRYGGEAGRRWPRLALHATALQLAHPVTGRELALHAALPADLLLMWEQAGGRPGPDRREG